MIAIIACALTCASCGSGSSGLGPSAYMRSVCGAILPFKSDLVNRESALAQTQSGSSPAARKTTLVGFFDAAVADSGRTLSKLKTIGTPAVGNGDQVQAAVVKVFSRLNAAMATAASQANQLPTTSSTVFVSSARTLIANFETAVSGLGTGIGNLKSQELEKAALKIPACSGLNG
ncbi:MAG: hypothetical protein ACYDHH_02920 [Solirubrobacteraceae bacterium]